MKHSDKDIEAATACYKEHQWIPATMEEREIRAFLAGLEHKQEEVDELVKGLQQALRFVKSSREDYDELQELIQKHKR